MYGELGYLQLLKKVIEEGEDRKTRNSSTRSLFGETLEFDITNDFPLLTTKRIFWRGVVEELMWFLRGDTNSKLLEEKGVNIWKGNSSREFLDSIGLNNFEEGDCGAIYGYQWRNFGGSYTNCNEKNMNGIDQLNNIINELKNNPTSRRMFMSAWNPSMEKQMVLPPCHVSYQFYVRQGKYLDCQMYQRSADLFLGLPFNIASTALLTYILAKHTGYIAGKIRICIGDCHIYHEHFDAVKEQLNRIHKQLPKLNIKDFEKIEELRYEDFELIGYTPDNTIKAPMIA
jgi:thymidylate synthase